MGTSIGVDAADRAYKGPLCQERNRRRELRPAKCGPTTADRGRHLAEPARPLVGQARESSPFTRKGRRITAQAKTRPSLRSGPGGDKQDKAVRPGDRPAAALGSARLTMPHRQRPGRSRIRSQGSLSWDRDVPSSLSRPSRGMHDAYCVRSSISFFTAS